ncbi:DUF5062 family protein [Paraferrimonas sp. SM1919]|uniref:DUF5062 family protein n=1 Tax=Paraferrimonas sp. SM1919 TaxID=2662263 RepID=UPI0013D40D3E|nr:DUF5062 family protein [Paraferrimonas sp. SM1919]
MKKFKNEGQLLKKSLVLAQAYGVQRGFGSFPPGASEKDKVEASYRMLVADKRITPLPPQKETGPEMRHRLVLWLTKQLPEDHPLLET